MNMHPLANELTGQNTRVGNCQHISFQYVFSADFAYAGTVTITPLNLIENIFEFHWQLEDDDNTARTGLAYLSDGVLCVGYGNDINAGVVLYNFRDTQMRGQWTMFSNRNHRFQEYLIRSSNGGLDDPGMLLEMSYRSEVNSKEA